jgi:hypothetical protein
MARYLVVKARNTETQQTVKQQDLNGRLLQWHQKREAEEIADTLAENLTKRTRQLWVGLVEEYHK